MGDLLLHPKMRRPTPLISTEPLPDEAAPALVAADVMEMICVYSSKLARIYGEDMARTLALSCVEDGLRKVR